MKNMYTDRPDRGSVLIIAIILALGIFIITGTYLNLATKDLTHSDNASLYNSLLNLGEGGAEDAVWALHENDWTGWSESSGKKVKRASNIDLGGGKSAVVSVMVEDWSALPSIYVEGKTFRKNGGKLVKQIRMDLAYRSLFFNGLTAKEALTISGGAAIIDSYDPGNGLWNATTNRGDKGTVGTLSIGFEDLDAGNSEIYGYVATGGGTPAFGSNAKVYGSDWTSGDPEVDTDRVRQDFNGNFPVIPPPTLSSPLVDSDVASIIGSSGGAASLTISAGTSGAPVDYNLTGLDMGNNKSLIITGHARMVVSGNVDINDLAIASGASLQLFVNGDFTVSGNSVANANPHTSSFVVYGTNESTVQTFTLNGASSLVAAVYAPNANVGVNGGGSGDGFSGAAVGKTIRLNGGVTFHYDESLSDFFGPDPKFKLKTWVELIKPTDRIDFDSFFPSS